MGISVFLAFFAEKIIPFISSESFLKPINGANSVDVMREHCRKSRDNPLLFVHWLGSCDARKSSTSRDDFVIFGARYAVFWKNTFKKCTFTLCWNFFWMYYFYGDEFFLD